MNLYADSSFIVASRVRHDTFHRVAVGFYKGHEADLWFWSPWHRVEVLNTIRQLTRNSDRKRGITQAEAKALIYRIEADVRLGYFFHMEADWRDVLRTGQRNQRGERLRPRVPRNGFAAYRLRQGVCGGPICHV